MAGMPALPLPPRGSMEWQQFAVCQWADPTLFISIDKRPGRNDRDRIAEAVRYCAQCSVARECLDWALDILQVAQQLHQSVIQPNPP
jgi:hypothetical protein